MFYLCLFGAGVLTSGIISVSGCMTTHTTSGLFIRQTWTTTQPENSRWITFTSLTSPTSNLCPRDYLHSATGHSAMLYKLLNIFYFIRIIFFFFTISIIICTALGVGIFRYLIKLRCQFRFPRCSVKMIIYAFWCLIFLIIICFYSLMRFSFLI